MSTGKPGHGHRPADGPSTTDHEESAPLAPPGVAVPHPGLDIRHIGPRDDLPAATVIVRGEEPDFEPLPGQVPPSSER